jgi:hypothetical protein
MLRVAVSTSSSLLYNVLKTSLKIPVFCPIAVLQAASKYSRTIVYAPFLKRLAPCYRTKSRYFKTRLTFI